MRGISNNDCCEQLIMNEEQVRALDKPGSSAIVHRNLRVSDEPGVGTATTGLRDAAAVTQVKVSEHLTPAPTSVPRN
ncbi:MAG: hypothetical protein BGO82_11300 [Devosia sp. 67-54]|uniref:hypothetical protein n=1 Tax=unclassified Devosia TaxID=196773 RepID=UPI0009627264|nr:MULTISPECIES: hypothetical protein [unclassified Devosia]MBN9304773.1 hypothetical protein [Devosia sp.]OJX15260.1 MAG: hypothetical protein BGO82_11300 [Devosia sp. 67-54]